MPATANRHRESRSASRHLRRRAASRASDHASATTIPRNTMRSLQHHRVDLQIELPANHSAGTAFTRAGSHSGSA